jgi:hypothetical protein
MTVATAELLWSFFRGSSLQSASKWLSGLRGGSIQSEISQTFRSRTETPDYQLDSWDVTLHDCQTGLPLFPVQPQ